MGLTLKEPEKKPRPLIPEGTYHAKCYAVADLGSHPNNYRSGELQAKVRIFWELSELMPDGRPYAISEKFTASLSPKANIRILLETWRGREFTPEELQGFHLSSVIGKDCFLSIVHKESKQGGNPYANVNGILKPPKGTPALAPINEPVFFDFDQFDPVAFGKLPEWVRKDIQESPEWKALMQEQEQKVSVDITLKEGEDIPF